MAKTSKTVVANFGGGLDYHAMAKTIMGEMNSIAVAAGDAGKETAQQFSAEFEKAQEQRLGSIQPTKEFRARFQALTGDVQKYVRDLQGINLNKTLAPLFEVFSTQRLGDSLPVLRKTLEYLQRLGSMPTDLKEQFSQQSESQQDVVLKKWERIVKEQEEVAKRIAKSREEQNKTYRDTDGNIILEGADRYSSLRNSYGKRQDTKERITRATSDESQKNFKKQLGIKAIRGGTEQFKQLSEAFTMATIMQEEYNKYFKNAKQGNTRAAAALPGLARDQQVVYAQVQNQMELLPSLIPNEAKNFEKISLTSLNENFSQAGMERLMFRAIDASEQALTAETKGRVERIWTEIMQYIGDVLGKQSTKIQSQAQGIVDRYGQKPSRSKKEKTITEETPELPETISSMGNLYSATLQAMEDKAEIVKSELEAVKAQLDGIDTGIPLTYDALMIVNDVQKYIYSLNDTAGSTQSESDYKRIIQVKPHDLYERLQRSFGNMFNKSEHEFEQWLGLQESNFSNANFNLHKAKPEQNSVRARLLQYLGQVDNDFHESINPKGKQDYGNILIHPRYSEEEIDRMQDDQGRQQNQYDEQNTTATTFRSLLEGMTELPTLPSSDQLSQNEETINVASADNEQQNEELNAARQQAQELQGQKDALQHAVDEAESRASDLETVIHEKEDKITSITNELATARTEAENARKEAEAAQAEAERAKAAQAAAQQATNLSTSVEDKESSVGERTQKEEEIRALEQELDETQRDAYHAQEDLRQAQQTLTEEREAHARAIKEQQTTLEAVQKENAELTQRATQAEEHTIAAEREAQTAQSTIASNTLSEQGQLAAVEPLTQQIQGSADQAIQKVEQLGTSIAKATDHTIVYFDGFKEQVFDIEKDAEKITDLFQRLSESWSKVGFRSARDFVNANGHITDNLYDQLRTGFDSPSLGSGTYFTQGQAELSHWDAQNRTLYAADLSSLSDMLRVESDEVLVSLGEFFQEQHALIAKEVFPTTVVDGEVQQLYDQEWLPKNTSELWDNYKDLLSAFSISKEQVESFVTQQQEWLSGFKTAEDIIPKVQASEESFATKFIRTVLNPQGWDLTNLGTVDSTEYGTLVFDQMLAARQPHLDFGVNQDQASQFAQKVLGAIIKGKASNVNVNQPELIGQYLGISQKNQNQQNREATYDALRSSNSIFRSIDVNNFNALWEDLQEALRIQEQSVQQTTADLNAQRKATISAAPAIDTELESKDATIERLHLSLGAMDREIQDKSAELYAKEMELEEALSDKESAEQAYSEVIDRAVEAEKNLRVAEQREESNLQTIQELKNINAIQQKQMAEVQSQAINSANPITATDGTASSSDNIVTNNNASIDTSVLAEAEKIGSVTKSIDTVTKAVEQKNQAFLAEKKVVERVVLSELDKLKSLSKQLLAISNMLAEIPLLQIVTPELPQQVETVYTNVQSILDQYQSKLAMNVSVKIAPNTLKNLQDQLTGLVSSLAPSIQSIQEILTFSPKISDLSKEQQVKQDSIVKAIQSQLTGVANPDLLSSLSSLSSKLQNANVSSSALVTNEGPQTAMQITAPPELVEIRDIVKGLAKLVGVDTQAQENTKDFVKVILDWIEANRASQAYNAANIYDSRILDKKIRQSDIERAFGANWESGHTTNPFYQGEGHTVPGPLVREEIQPELMKRVNEIANVFVHSHPDNYNAVASLADLHGYITDQARGVQHGQVVSNREIQYIDSQAFYDKMAERAGSKNLEDINEAVDQFGSSVSKKIEKIFHQQDAEVNDYGHFDFLKASKQELQAYWLHSANVGVDNNGVIDKSSFDWKQVHERFAQAIENTQYSVNSDSEADKQVIRDAMHTFQNSVLSIIAPDNINDIKPLTSDLYESFYKQFEQSLIQAGFSLKTLGPFEDQLSPSGESIWRNLKGHLQELQSFSIKYSPEQLMAKYNTVAESFTDENRLRQLATSLAMKRTASEWGLDGAMKWFSPEEFAKWANGDTTPQTGAAVQYESISTTLLRILEVLTSIRDSFVTEAVNITSGTTTTNTVPPVADLPNTGLIDSQQDATSVGALSEKISDVTDQIHNKTAAFEEEKGVVSSVVSDEQAKLQELSSEITNIKAALSGEYTMHVLFSPTLQDIQNRISELQSAYLSNQITYDEFHLGVNTIDADLNTLQEKIATWLMQENNQIQAWFDGLQQSLTVKASSKKIIDAIFQAINQAQKIKVPTNNKDGLKKQREADADQLVQQIQKYLEKKKIYAWVMPKLISKFKSELDKQIKEKLKKATYKVQIEPEVKTKQEKKSTKQSGQTEEEKAAKQAQKAADAAAARQKKQEESQAQKRAEYQNNLTKTGMSDILGLDKLAIFDSDKYTEKVKSDYHNLIGVITNEWNSLNLTDTTEANVERVKNKIVELIKVVKQFRSERITNPDDIVAESAQIDQLTIQIERFLRANSSMSQQYKNSLNELKNQLKSVTSQGDVEKITGDFQKLRAEIISTGQTGISFADRFKRKLKEIAAYMSTYVSFYRVLSVIRQGFATIQQFDSALTEMMKVSNETQESLRSFQKTSFGLAASVGTTAVQIQNSTADFMRQGETQEQAQRSAVTANKLLAVSEFSDISAATEALTAMSQAYKELDKDAIVDVVNELGNNYAISTNGVAEALQQSASALRTAQNDLYEAAALVTAGNQVVQDPSKVGTGLRTIALRITGTSAAKKELEEQGEDVDDFVMTTSSKMDAKIRGLTQVITDSGEKMSVSILDANGNYRSTYEILLDIAKIWDQIAKEDKVTGENRQNALLELLAGKVRANIAASILENPEVLERAYNSALNSQGSADIELEKYQASIEGHVNIIKTQWQELWDGANNRDFINWWLDAAAAVLKFVNTIGIIPSILGTITVGGGQFTLINLLKGNKPFPGLSQQGTLVNEINSIKDQSGLNLFLDSGDLNVRAFENLKNTLKNTTEAQKVGIIQQSAYSKEQKEIIQNQLGIKAAVDATNDSVAMGELYLQGLGAKFKAIGATLKGIVIAHPEIVLTIAAVGALVAMIVTLTQQQKKQQKQQEELTKSAKNFNIQLKEFQTTANNNQSTLSSLDKKFEKQSEGVDALGQNVSQTDEQYQEYLDICNQVASISPDQVSGYTAEGNAIINLTDKVHGLSDAYQETIARRAQVFLNKGDDEGNTAQSIEDYYKSVIEGSTGDTVDFYTQLGLIESQEEFGAYIDNLQSLRDSYYDALPNMIGSPMLMEQWQASAQGQAAKQLEEVSKFLAEQNIDWDPLTQDYSEVSSDVSQGQLRSVFHINEGAAKQIIDDAVGQVMTLLRTRLDANMDTLSEDEYNIISSLLSQQSSQDIQTLMGFEDYSTAQIMQILVSQLSEQENVDVSEIQKAITYKTLSPKMTVSEMKEVEGQYLDILETLFGGMMSRDELTESFGLDASEQLEKRIEQTAVRFALPRTNATTQDILSEMEELGIDTQNELGMFAESWADTWDVIKQNWDEVIQAYLDRLAESVKMDWSGNKEMLDTLQSDINDLGSMVQDLYVNPVDPEKIIDIMQTLGEKGYDVADYANIDAALDAYYGHVRETMMEKLDEIGASNELKEYFQTMFNDALNVNLFDQVSDLEKSLGNIQSAYDNVQAAMKEYNELGFLTMGTIDSLVALDDSYINTQIDQNGVLQYNEETFKQVALARIDEAKAAIWEETNSELVRIAHLNEEAAAQELAKANGTLSDSAYRQARASQVQAQAAGTVQRQLADKVWEAGNKRVKLLDYQMGQLKNGTYDFGRAAAGAASSAESSYGELFDFFERRVEVLEQAQSILEKSGELLEGAPAKNALLNQNTAIVKEELKNYKDALGMYTTAANFYFDQLDAEMQEKILNGSVDLKAMIGENGEAVNDLLESYVEWANKAQDCREKLIELRKELAQLELAKFKNVQQDYINQFDLFQGSIDNQDAQIALAEEAGELVGQAFYEEQRREATEQLRITTEEYAALQDQLNQSLQSGLIEEGSDEWLEMVKALQEVEKQSLSTEKQIVALNKSIRQQKWDTFTRTMTEYENLGTELENLGELFNDQTDIEVSDGFLNWTEAATAQQGTLVQRYETSKQSIFAYQRAISDLNDEYAAGKWSTIEYNEKLWELKQGQWGAVESCEALEDAIMDMNEKAVDEAIERINDEIEAYQELTDAQKESLQAEKDLHDWQKKLTESNKNISDLERQIAAMQNDNTASTVAKRKKLEEELAEAKADLEEEEYQHSIDTQQDALDKQMKEYQKNREKEIKQLEESLKDRTKLIQQVFNWVLENAASIGLALEEMAKQNGINISTYITEPWTAGATALGGYSTVLTESTGAWATILEGISQAQIALQAQANGTGQAIVDESNESKDSVWGLSQQLKDSYDDANNLKETCDAITDGSFTELEEGFSAENVVSALSAIATAAASAADAIGRAVGLLNEYNKTPVEQKVLSGPQGSIIAQGTSGLQGSGSANNRHPNIFVQKYAKGGLIAKDDNGVLDAVAHAVGEDTMIAARYGESVLTPLQTDAMIKMAPFLETIASQLPDFSRAGKIAAPMVGSGMVNNAVQIGSLVTINGNVDDNNLKQIQQTVQTELRKSFSKINRDFKYT